MVEQFAQMYGEKVRVIGMGTQDSLGQAEDFVSSNNLTTPLMTWDASFETWNYYQVRGQPTVILLDPSGTPMGQWVGLTQEAATMVDNFGA